MLKPPRLSAARTTALALLLLIALSGCRTTVPIEEHEALQEELSSTTASLEDAEERLETRRSRIVELESQIGALDQSLREEQADTTALESDLRLALSQLGALREQRLDLEDELAALEAEVERLRSAAIAVQRMREAVATGENTSRPAERDPHDAMASALEGDGFSRVSQLGFQNDPRATARLSAAAPGIGVDTRTGVPILYDSRLDYEKTLVYLSIVDPEARRPRLQLTARYISQVEPLYLRTAFITIEGGDPIDPVDPIVLTNEPVRRTDGTLLSEALVMKVEPDTIERLSALVSSNRFLVTFVGMDQQVAHRPSVGERAAMSNILFAFFDLGGAR